MKRNLKPYVGITADERVVFKNRLDGVHPQYREVIGPFRTLRAATFCSLNHVPTRITVEEWESAAKAAENIRRKKK